MTMHKDQLFHDAATLTEAGNGNDLLVGPGEYDIAAHVSAITGDATLEVYESADDSTYNLLATFPTVDAVGEWHRKVVTEKEYLRLKVTPGTTITLTAGPTRGRGGTANK